MYVHGTLSLCPHAAVLSAFVVAFHKWRPLETTKYRRCGRPLAYILLVFMCYNISMVDLRDMTIGEMESFFVELGEPKYRAHQVFSWLYKGVTDFDEMVNIPKVLREKLSGAVYIGRLAILEVQESKSDGTQKFLFGLTNGGGTNVVGADMEMTYANASDADMRCADAVEAVFMKYKYGNSICISSQAGCRMGCKFCASTRNGLSRNLTVGEMVSQVLEATRQTGEFIGHMVVMGTGEPFDNYENLSRFISILHEKEGLGLSNRNITVSTCGIVPKIYDFAKDHPQVNLAISLHAATDGKRSAMMPINNKYKIAEIMKAAKHYTAETGRRITFEYTMVNGVNDSDEDARNLMSLLKGLNCHVNLIPLNKVEGTGFDTVSRKRAEEFAEMLENSGVTATVRRELGSDIDAACGQLRLKKSRE